jgi:dephospho-CoA kinase
MLKIGVTGGIGSGKTTVCKVLETLDFPVFYSDLEAKRIMLKDEKAKEGIQNIFGKEAYIDDEINRTYIAEKIFSSPELKKQINDLIHPLVRKAFKDWCEKQKSPFVFNEAAILFETGSYKQFDYTLLVTAPKPIRINRVVKRDNTTKKEVENRMKNQWDDEKKIALADFVLHNDDKQLVTTQLLQIIDQLMVKK